MGHWSSELLFFSGSPADLHMPGFGGVGGGGLGPKSNCSDGSGEQNKIDPRRGSWPSAQSSVG